MTAGLETIAMKQFLTTKLTADSALAAVVSTRIYDGVAPAAATFPCVVFQNQSAGGIDVVATGALRIMTDSLFVVKGIARTQSFMGDLKTIATRIDAALHGISGTATDGTVIACVRERAFELIETTDGVQYRHLGGVYRLLAQ